jgi:hypothetical protein
MCLSRRDGRVINIVLFSFWLISRLLTLLLCRASVLSADGAVPRGKSGDKAAFANAFFDFVLQFDALRFRKFVALTFFV